jgi:uncharacterized membrane protein required for colicin V production
MAMELTVLDAVLLGLVLVGGAWGLVVGALRVAGPLALLVAVLTLVHAYPELSTRLGAHPTVRFFLPLLVGFVGVVVYGFVAHLLRGALRWSPLGFLNRLLGLGLGLVTGTILAGALVWGLKTYGGLSGMMLLHGSTVAPATAEFFRTVMACTQRLFPRPDPGPEQVPWWKRPLW